MAIGYTECPYCYKETEIDYEGQKQGEEFKQICNHCNKEFITYYELSIDFYSKELGEK